MNIYLDDGIDSYRTFLKIKTLPRYEIHGRMAFVPDEYAAGLGIAGESSATAEYVPSEWLFYYQPATSSKGHDKQKQYYYATLYCLDAFLDGRRVTRIMQPKLDREMEVEA
jgi:hypothetical protein